MRPIERCARCRDAAGRTRQLLGHGLFCRGGIVDAFRLLGFTLAAAVMISLFPTAPPPLYSGESAAGPGPAPLGALGAGLTAARSETPLDPTEASIEDMLARHSLIGAGDRARIARAVAASARRHDVDPYLVTGILLVESSGDPYAISHRDAVGLMQIHVPTWGAVAETEDINLFRVEDNVELGTRSLKEYTSRYGLWDGIIRYLGAVGPTDEALEYVRRVQTIYSDRMAD